MKEQLVTRLQELKAEYESGRKIVAELEVKQANIKNTLMRISGAIQVLEEELSRESGPREGGSAPEAAADEAAAIDVSRVHSMGGK